MPAVAIDHFTQSASPTFAFTVNAQLNNCLVLIYHNNSNDPASGIVYNGVDNFTQVNSALRTTEFTEIWVMLNPTQSGGNIVVSGTAGNDEFTCYQLYNVGEVGNDVTGNNTSTAITVTPTSVGADDMVIAGNTHRVQENCTVTGGSEDYDDNFGAVSRETGANRAGGAAVTFTYATSARNAAVAVNLVAFVPSVQSIMYDFGGFSG